MIFDRSWYNRTGVERVMGFTDEKVVMKFLEDVPKVEKAMVDSGIILIKYWLEVSAEEQTKRLSARIDDGRKIWKLSPMDLKSYSKWYDYSRARDDMFKYTHTAWAPWIVADSDDKKRARLNIIRDLLSRVPYKEAPREKIKLPEAAEGSRLQGTEARRRVREGAVLIRARSAMRAVALLALAGSRPAARRRSRRPRRPRPPAGASSRARGTPRARGARLRSGTGARLPSSISGARCSWAARGGRAPDSVPR